MLVFLLQLSPCCNSLITCSVLKYLTHNPMAMIYFEPCTPPSSFVIITISKCKGIESLLINSRELSTRYLRAVKRGGKSERVTYNMLSRKKKRDLVFNWLVAKKIDVICLQETH